MVKGEYILGAGIVFDMITTILGMSLGFSEGNTIGFYGVILLALGVMYASLFTINLKRPNFINILLYIVGGSRFIIGVMNLILIL